MDRVPRAVRGRKGFDYGQIARLMAKHFSFLRLEGVGLMNLPPYLSTNIGIVASKQPFAGLTRSPVAPKE